MAHEAIIAQAEKVVSDQEKAFLAAFLKHKKSKSNEDFLQVTIETDLLNLYKQNLDQLRLKQ